jgi:hypothetical protein
MADQFVVVVEGLLDLKGLEGADERVKLNMVRSVNKVIAQTRTESRKRILGQINFPTSYLDPSAGRFYVSRLATQAKPEAAITARRRPTSLARFIVGSPAPGKEGVTVSVGKGKTETLRRAFVMRLRAGSASLDTKSNLGLAVRLKRGETLRNKNATVKMANGLYLLYGPSIQQVFLDNSGQGVAQDVSPFALEKLEDEFDRLMDTLF